MQQWLERIAGLVVGALGGFLSGVAANTFLHSLFLQLFYQEGWYMHRVPFLLIPAIVLLVFASAIAASNSPWRFFVASLLVVPIFVGYILVRAYVPLSVETGWIEFSLLWTMVGQVAAILLVASWVLFWRTYDRVQTTPRAAAGEVLPPA